VACAAENLLWAIYIRARAAELVALGPDLIVVWANRDIAAGMGQVCDKAATDWIGYNNEYDLDLALGTRNCSFIGRPHYLLHSRVGGIGNFD
jgi:hypothetical protein